MCMIVKIDKLSHEMRGIAKIDNKVTFVDKVIPNEVVNIRITKQKKKINEAKLVSIIEKSTNRIDLLVSSIIGFSSFCAVCYARISTSRDRTYSER